MHSLGNDLARIRKERDFNLEDIQRATKIPPQILRSIEDDSIFSDLQEDPIYVRNYVRSYAKALSIDEQRIVNALDKKEKGLYEGGLQKLLDEGEESKQKSTFGLDQDEADSTEKQSADTDNRMIHDHSPEFNSKNNKPADSKDKQPESEEEIPTVKSIDWADVGQQFQPMKSTKSKIWIGILGIILIVGVIIYFFFYESKFTTTNNTTGKANTEITTENSDEPVDSLQLSVMPSSAVDTVSAIPKDTSTTTKTLENATLNQLPDTLNVVLYAAHGKLEPVRVFTDIMDNINPYWIEQGVAYRFNFVDELQIRGQYSHMELMLNGHPIRNLREQFYNPETRLLEINRSFFEGDSTWLQAAPDSLPIGAPPPSSIKGRPIFN